MSRFSGFDHQFVAVSVACVVVLVSARATAATGEGGPRPVRIDYDAPASCPDQRAFEAQLRARSARIVIAQDAKTTVRVRIAARAARFDGEVVLTDAAGGETTRHVDGACPDVVAALSLIAAVALDPMASTASDPLAAPSASAVSVPETPAKTDDKKPAAPAVIVPPDAKDGDSSSREEAAVPGASTHHVWRWSIGAGVGVTGGIAPDLAVSIPAFVDVARWARGPLSPSFRLRFERTSIDGAAGGANFTWTAGSLDACPIALSTPAFRVWPCARVEAGALEATGDASSSRTSTRPWISAGALVRARLVIVGGLFVEVEGGAYVPIVRDRFFLEPDETVHRAPVVSAAGASSLGASFW
jgi:hypothetical protein